jgi:hypothetical protein
VRSSRLARRAVVGGRVHVGDRQQLRIADAHGSVVQQRRLVEERRAALVQQERRAQPVLADQPGALRSQRRAVGRDEGLPEAAHDGDDGIGAGVEGPQDTSYEGGVQEGQVGRADEGGAGPAARGCSETDREPLQRAEPLDGVVEHLHRGRERWQRGARCAHDEHRPVDHASEHAGGAPQQRRAVPLERRLAGAHAPGAPAGEDDPGGCCHGRSVRRS